MAQPTSFIVFAGLVFILLNTSIASAVTYNVLNLGAKPDGKTESTKAFLNAWAAACGSATPATIYVPLGRYLLKSAIFEGQNCKNSAIMIRIDGTLVAPSDYHVIGNAGNWLLFRNVHGVSIYGGTLDGQGTGLWACKNSGKSCPSGATSLRFVNSNNIAISGLTSLNSQMFHIVINSCQNIKLQSVKVSASGNSPNTDGIHVERSTGVTILGANIKTGDDCISIGPGTTNLWIEKVTCGPGHGISIGSLGKTLQEPGVQNVTVKTTTFTGSQNGVRIKAWGRPSNGFVKGILFQHALMVNVKYPIVIDQNYCPSNKGNYAKNNNACRILEEEKERRMLIIQPSPNPKGCAYVPCPPPSKKPVDQKNFAGHARAPLHAPSHVKVPFGSAPTNGKRIGGIYRK